MTSGKHADSADGQGLSHAAVTGEYNSDHRKSRKITPVGSYKVFSDGGREFGLGLQASQDIGTRFSFSGMLDGRLGKITHRLGFK
jgi:hypothetical protein